MVFFIYFFHKCKLDMFAKNFFNLAKIFFEFIQNVSKSNRVF